MEPITLPPLSVLDLATVAAGASPADALAQTTELAVLAESLGYHRFWVAEHHGMPAIASSSPPVLIAHLAAATRTVRVGSGGVMLPNHAPLVVAEQFGTLEALHPGRIDLGLGRAPGTDPRTARALRRTSELGADTFPDDLVELVGYLTGRDPAGVRAFPGAGYLPEVWLLGSSLFSAQLAGLLGLPFSFAHHFSPRYTEPALAAYRTSFRPYGGESQIGSCPAPHAMVAAVVVAAADDAQAAWIAAPSALSMLQLRTGRLGPLPTPEEAAAYVYSDAERALVDQITASWIVGGPETVAAGVEELVRRTGADELMVTTRAHDPADRARSLEIVAALANHRAAGHTSVPATGALQT